MITHLFIQHKCIECLLCILDIRDPIVNKRDKGTCPTEFTFLLGTTINTYTGLS